MSTTLCPLSETVMNTSGKWSLADRNNTTNTDSARGLDFTTQYQTSVSYERGLQDLYDNAYSELKDLQFKARERSPYNTNLCTLQPMYPTWNAAQPCFPPSCGLNMHPTCLGNTSCNIPNTLFAGINPDAPFCPGSVNPNALIPGAFLGAEQEAADLAAAYSNEIGDVVVSDSEEDEEEAVVVSESTADPKPMKRVSRNMVRALMGVAYDLNHWKELPPQKSRLSTGKTLKFVIGRDNRPLYIVMLIAFFVFIIAIMVGIACLTKKAHRRHKKKKVLKDLQEKAYLQYQMQKLPAYESSLLGGRKW
jgi:hypothetical protein